MLSTTNKTCATQPPFVTKCVVFLLFVVLTDNASWCVVSLCIQSSSTVCGVSVCCTPCVHHHTQHCASCSSPQDRCLVCWHPLWKHTTTTRPCTSRFITPHSTKHNTMWPCRACSSGGTAQPHHATRCVQSVACVFNAAPHQHSGGSTTFHHISNAIALQCLTAHHAFHHDLCSFISSTLSCTSSFAIIILATTRRTLTRSMAHTQMRTTWRHSGCIPICCNSNTPANKQPRTNHTTRVRVRQRMQHTPKHACHHTLHHAPHHHL